ncbi:hypothetical protein ABT147_25760 [Streptomyces sp. NPDC001868]|uniref:hypothetical protein n=1 Tax=Streptomyces sp. NPDC001868 TaxID=3154401 RepID=UPI003333BA4C
MATVLSFATVMTAVSPASAATNIRGAEPFNTDKLLMSLCNGRTGTQEGLINVDTGELRSLNNWNDIRGRWERYRGWCSYPKASSWTWTGGEQRVSDTIVNCSSGSSLSQGITSSGSTTSTTSNSVTGSVGIQWTPLKDVLSVQAGGEYTRTWSYATTKGWSKTSTLTVPARRVGWMVQRPEMRTVRSNPVFHVEAYTWNTLPFANWTTVNSWRGRGYRDIKSHGAYYDAKANVTNNDGSPVGQIVARDRAVNSGDRC